MPVEPDFLAILEILDRHEVEFVICGGIAAILHGAPIMTADLDVVYAATEENCRRLLAATGELDAVYFDVARRRIVPDLAKLRALRMHLLETNLGRLDLMREIGAGQSYDDLVGRSEIVELEGTKVRVLGLEAIIESKEAAGRPKDLATLPLLKALARWEDES